MVTCSEPEVAFDEVHDAEQELAFEEDQVNVDSLFNKTDVGSADKETLGAGVVGADDCEPPPPPPPPPPHDVINSIEIKLIKKFLTKNILA